MAGGVWAGIIWAFARVALGHDLDASWDESEGEQESRRRDDGQVTVGEAEWTDADALDETVLPPEEMPPSASPMTARDGGGWHLLGAGSPGRGASRQGQGRFPKQLLATAPGVVDVSRVLAQTGVVPNRIPPVQVVPIVEVGQGGEPLPAPPPAETRPGTYAYHRDDKPMVQAPPDVPPEPPPEPAAAPQAQPLPNPQPARHPYDGRDPDVRVSHGAAFMSPAWQVEPTPGACAPARSPLPAPAPAPRAASQAPGPVPPAYGFALRWKPPEDVVSLRDVPLGWSPDPSMLQTGSMNELLTLRDQLYRLAVNGCFVVGVTSGAAGTPDKSCIAAQLAAIVAGPGRARVLLIEANFNRPAVHRLMRIDMPFSQGFSEQMRRRMTPAPKKPWVLFRCAANLHVLAEGLVRSPGLLSSVQFGEAIIRASPLLRRHRRRRPHRRKHHRHGGLRRADGRDRAGRRGRFEPLEAARRCIEVVRAQTAHGRDLGGRERRAAD